MEIYNPKDCWHRPYFIISTLGPYHNRDCALSEEDYEKMCDIKGVNPIYPGEFIIDPTIEKEKPRKKIIPRPPKGPKYKKVDDVYDRIKKRREELGITI